MLDAVRSLVAESNSLFDDMAKKIKDYPELRNMFYDILFCGRSIPYNLGTELVSVGTMFGFLFTEVYGSSPDSFVEENYFFYISGR